jgi:hypothetical protein
MAWLAFKIRFKNTCASVARRPKLGDRAELFDDPHAMTKLVPQQLQRRFEHGLDVERAPRLRHGTGIHRQIFDDAANAFDAALALDSAAWASKMI